MSSTYNSNPASGAWSPALSITEPADGDLANVASVNMALSKLADFIAFLQANAGQKGGANTWTQAQTIQALLSLTNNLAFSAAVAQTLLKTAAGGLTVGTAAGGGDLTLSANGVALLKLLASGSMDAQGKVLGNLGAPAVAGDALSKVALSWATMASGSANWTAGPGHVAPAYWKDAAGIVHLRGHLTCNTGYSTSLVTVAAAGALPAGCRPLGQRQIPGAVSPTGAAVLTGQVVVGADGSISLSTGTSRAWVINDVIWLDGVTFVAEQ